MFTPSRDEARSFLFAAWRKQCDGMPMTPLEDMAAQLIERHPEYHDLLSDPERYRDADFQTGGGEVNPFLHLMMHVAIEEQLSIGQPFGIREQFARLTRKYGSEHEAQHAMMECLSEMIRQAQARNASPDAAVYFSCLERQ
ncbi:MAG: DUF1841 family protein [Gallionellaceae bacterium]|jgi:hypothetical protein|nr:DUF1841 family protein [Gallionellaceae bacterium]